MEGRLIVQGFILIIVALVLNLVKGMFGGLVTPFIYVAVVILVIFGVLHILEGLIGPLRHWIRLDEIFYGLLSLGIAYILNIIRETFFTGFLKTLLLILVLVFVILGIIEILNGLLVSLKRVRHKE